MLSYINEINEYLLKLIEEHNNDYLENYDEIFNLSLEQMSRIDLRNTTMPYTYISKNTKLEIKNKIIKNISNILKKIYLIEKKNNLFKNVKYSEFMCDTINLFNQSNIINLLNQSSMRESSNVIIQSIQFTDIYNNYGVVLRKVYLKSINLNDDLILF